MRAFRILLINAVVTTLLLAAIFVLLEWVARWWLWNRAGDEAFQKYASYVQRQEKARLTGDDFERYVMHRYIGYVPKANYRNGPNRHNSLGFRGGEIEMPKPPGEFRIVCIGGSTTYTPGAADYRQTYPAQMESFLRKAGYNVRVVNAGGESWMSHASLINLQLRIVDLEPDLIIVYHAINDIIGRAASPPEMYRGDNSGAKLPTVSNRFMPSILELSTLFRIVLIRNQLAEPHASIHQTINRTTPNIHGLEFQYVDGKISETELDISAKRVSEILKKNKPVYFRRNLENMAYVARFHGFTCVFATFARSTEFHEFPWVSNPNLAWAFDEANAIIKDIAASTGSPCYDFAAEFPKTREYFYDGCHVTVEGAKLKASMFARFLLQNNLIPVSYKFDKVNQ